MERLLTKKRKEEKLRVAKLVCESLESRPTVHVNSSINPCYDLSSSINVGYLHDYGWPGFGF